MHSTHVTTTTLYAHFITEENVEDIASRYKRYVMPARQGGSIDIVADLVIVVRVTDTIIGEFERKTTEYWLASREDFDASFDIIISGLDGKAELAMILEKEKVEAQCL